MEVKVTCPKCGEEFSVQPAQVVRKVKCSSCSHQFVPIVDKGVSCPACDAVVILPYGKSKLNVICPNCSFIFRRPKWWLRRKTLIRIAIGCVLVIAAAFVLVRWWSNARLAKEIRTEYESWLETLPEIPDSENGMILILKGLESFSDTVSSPDWEMVATQDFDESRIAIRRQYLAEKEEGLRLICEGLKYEKFQLQVPIPEDDSEQSARRLPSMLAPREAAYALLMKGNIAKCEGKKSEALAEYLNALRFGKTFSSGCYLISYMIECAVLKQGLERLIDNLSETSFEEKDLASTLETLKRLHSKGSSFLVAMETDYYWFLEGVRTAIEGNLYERYGWKIGLFKRIRMSKFLHNYRSDVENYRKTLEICRKVEPAKYYTLPTVMKNYQPPPWSKSPFLEIPGVDYLIQTPAQIETLWRGAIVLAGIRLFEARQGRLPKSLSELGELIPEQFLTDPLSGKDLIYRLEGNDFFLSSVGHSDILPNPVFHFPVPVEKEK